MDHAKRRMRVERGLSIVSSKWCTAASLLGLAFSLGSLGGCGKNSEAAKGPTAKDATATTATLPPTSFPSAASLPAAKAIAPATTTASEETAAGFDLVGKEVPDFKAVTLDGQSVSKADLKGKVYVLDFWATWCTPCRASLPHLDELYRAEKSAGFVAFAVDHADEKPLIVDFVSKTKLGVPVLLDDDGKVSDAFKVDGIPQTVVVGKDGKVAKVMVGFNKELSPPQLKAAVEAELSK